MSGVAPGRIATLGAVALLTVSASSSGLAATPGQAPELAAAVRARLTPEGLQAQVEAIVRHDRRSGGAGENAAIDHIVRTLEGDGVATEVHAFRAWTSDPIAASVSVPGAAFDPQAITVAYSGSVDALEGEAVDLGSTSDLPEILTSSGEQLDLGPWSGPDPTGKIVIIEGLPGPDEAWTLQQLGAAGAIFVNPAERLNELITTTVWGSPSLRNAHRDPKLPVAEIRASDGERLRQLVGSGYAVRMSAQTRTGWRLLRLPVARIEPTDGSDAFVLLGGHIDSWHYGAIDEGASNAAMLELARAFHAERAQLRRGLVVAWWPGHSTGRYAGSTWFADRFFESLSAGAIAYLNIDGVGQAGAKRFGVAATASLEGLARQVVERVAGERERPRVRRPGRNSDQAFNGIGMPLLQFNHSRLQEDGGYWFWHTPEDTLDKVDAEVLVLDAGLYAGALASLLAEPLPAIGVVAEMAEILATLSDLDSAAGDAFSLAETRLRLAALIKVAGELRRALARDPGDGDAALALVQLLRPLYRVMLTRNGAFHPDPAIAMGRLPGLAPMRGLSELDPDSAAYGFTLTELVRERNRLHDAIDRSLEVALRAAPGGD